MIVAVRYKIGELSPVLTSRIFPSMKDCADWFQQYNPRILWSIERDGEKLFFDPDVIYDEMAVIHWR